MFGTELMPGESADDYQWRQQLDAAAEAVCETADARSCGDFRRADDRGNYAEWMLGHTEAIRKRS